MLKWIYDSFKKKFKSQKEEVLFLLQASSTGVSCFEFAMEYGILRYWASIFQLRKEGYNIEMEDKYVKKNWRTQRQTVYFLKRRKSK